jgi:hypothetical protein
VIRRRSSSRRDAARLEVRSVLTSGCLPKSGSLNRTSRFLDQGQHKQPNGKANSPENT